MALKVSLSWENRVKCMGIKADSGEDNNCSTSKHNEETSFPATTKAIGLDVPSKIISILDILQKKRERKKD